MFKWSYIFSFLLCVLARLDCFAQINETFDNEINTSGIWVGDLDDFIVNDQKQAQLNASSPGKSRLATSIEWQDSSSFSFWFGMDFDPSNNNYMIFYISSDRDTLFGGKGVYGRIGKNGATDGFDFYTSNGVTQQLLIAGVPGMFASKPKGWIRGRIIEQSLFLNYVDPNQQEFLIFQGTRPAELELGTSVWMGFEFVYTSSNTDGFILDDIIVEKYRGPEPPKVTRATFIDTKTIAVTFNQLMDQGSATDINNFELRDDLGSILSIEQVNGQTLEFEISLVNDIQPNKDYLLKISGVKNASGLVMDDANFNIRFEPPVEIDSLDILINELLPDPTPVVSLPNSEFIELYNASDKVIDLSHLKFVKGASNYSLPSFEFLPNQYLILVDDDNLPFWSEYTNVVGLTSFPGLTNESMSLDLRQLNEKIIHQVSYNLDTYGDPIKKNGGWSLESNYIALNCPILDQWKASNDPTGGTPGRLNSKNFSLNVQSFDFTVDQLTVCLNKSINLDHPDNPKFIFEPTLDFEVETSGISNCLVFRFPNQAATNQFYQLTFGPNYLACDDSQLSIDTTIQFGAFAGLLENDLLINEILFDPISGGEDYIELYNNSNHTINLKGLTIANHSNEESAEVIQDIYLKQGEYLVFTDQPNWLLQNYFAQNPEQVYQLNLPAFNNDAGNVYLSYMENGMNVYIDSLDYHEDMHNIFLANKEGISLERISLNQATNLRQNWTSAATTSNGGTPTYQNSQFRILNNPNQRISVLQDHFSPNGDGFQDELMIQFNLPKEGYLADVSFYDLNGHLVNSKLKSELVGQQGIIKWEGDDDNGNKVLAGIYIILVHLTHPDGSLIKDKLSTVVSYPN